MSDKAQRDATEWRLLQAHRPAVVEAIAIALCRHAYPSRSLDEAISPTRELWQRLLPEAEIAAEAAFKALDHLSQRSETRAPLLDPLALADMVVMDVCEIPDRTSPEDEPQMMLVKDSELRNIVYSRVMEALAAPSAIAPSFTRIGFLHRVRDGQTYFNQTADVIPLGLHETLNVYMKDGDRGE